MWAPSLLLLLSLSHIISATPPAQMVYQDVKPHHDRAGAAYHSFVEHFAAPQTHGAAYLIDSLRKLHSAKSLVATQAREFDMARFVGHGGNNASMTSVKGDVQAILAKFVPAAKRTEGGGTLNSSAIFAAYDVKWAGKDFRVYDARWQQGFNDVRQSHVVADSEEDANSLILAVSAFYNSLNEVILVFDQSDWTADAALWKAVQKASWSDVILDEDLKSAVRHDYLSFFNSSAMYQDLGVPWKRGIIFLGPPGNGKTISLKAIMKDVKVPTLYVKTFHTYAGDEFGIRMIFERARREAPCLLVLEDLDSLITENNRSFFLNEMDGLEDNDGLLLIGTTNHFDRLDPALSNRPSRFDRKFNFPDPSEPERRLYAIYWQNKLRGNPKIDFPDSLLDEVAVASPKFSFAYLKEAFVAALITLASDESDEPPAFRTVLLHQIELLKEQLDNGENSFFPEPVKSAEGGGPRGRMRGRIMHHAVPAELDV